MSFPRQVPGIPRQSDTHELVEDVVYASAAGNPLHFARHGIATISISYRLAPAHRFPAPLHDVRRALRYVRAHAGELGIDPDRIALMGLSAGAHLAMLAHLAAAVPELAPE